MTVTTAERERLWVDLDRLAARSGGIANRQTFDAVIDFSNAGDRDARRTLIELYASISRELIRERAGR